MSNTIEITTAAARELLPCLEGQLEGLLEQQYVIDEQVSSKRALIEEIKVKLSTKEIPLANGDAKRKRLPKGMADETIVATLKAAGEPGLKLPEIAAKTGIKYSTAFKILTNKDRNRERFVENEKTGEWSLKK